MGQKKSPGKKEVSRGKTSDVLGQSKKRTKGMRSPMKKEERRAYPHKAVELEG